MTSGNKLCKRISLLIITILFVFGSVQIASAACGNNYCESGEDCNNCWTDCGCSGNNWCGSCPGGGYTCNTVEYFQRCQNPGSSSPELETAADDTIPTIDCECDPVPSGYYKCPSGRSSGEPFCVGRLIYSCVRIDHCGNCGAPKKILVATKTSTCSNSCSNGRCVDRTSPGSGTTERDTKTEVFPDLDAYRDYYYWVEKDLISNYPYSRKLVVTDIYGRVYESDVQNAVTNIQPINSADDIICSNIHDTGFEISIAGSYSYLSEGKSQVAVKVRPCKEKATDIANMDLDSSDLDGTLYVLNEWLDPYKVENLDHDTEYCIYAQSRNRIGKANPIVGPQKCKTNPLECDHSKDRCECPTGNLCCGLSWVPSGEGSLGGYTQTGELGCCGDDTNEYSITSYIEKEKYSACCDKETDCVGSDNKCYSNYKIKDNLVCVNGEWNLDLPEIDCCNGKDDDFDGSIDGEDFDCVGDMKLAYGENKVCLSFPYKQRGDYISGIYSCPKGYLIERMSVSYDLFGYTSSFIRGVTGAGYILREEYRTGDRFYIIDGDVKWQYPKQPYNLPKGTVVEEIVGAKGFKSDSFFEKDIKVNKAVFFSNVFSYLDVGRKMSIDRTNFFATVSNIVCNYNCFEGSPSCSDNGYLDAKDNTLCYYGESFSPGKDLFSTKDDKYIPPTKVACNKENECSNCADKKCYYTNEGYYKWETKLSTPEKACEDSHDNDCDGKTDEEDPDCQCDYGSECDSGLCVRPECSNTGKCKGKKGVCRSCKPKDDGKTCSASHYVLYRLSPVPELGLCFEGECAFEGPVCGFVDDPNTKDKRYPYCDNDPIGGFFDKDRVCSFISEGPSALCSNYGETLVLLNTKRTKVKETDFITRYEKIPDKFYLLAGKCEEFTSALPEGVQNPAEKAESDREWREERDRDKKCTVYDTCDKKESMEDDCQHSLECNPGLVCCENSIEVKKDGKEKKLDDLCIEPDECWGDIDADCDVEIIGSSCYFDPHTGKYNVSVTVEWSGRYKYKAGANIAGSSHPRTQFPVFTASSSVYLSNTKVSYDGSLVLAPVEAIVYNSDRDMVCSESKFVECKRCDEDSINYNVCSLYPNVRCAIVKDDLTLSYGYCNDGECTSLEETFKPITIKPDRTLTCDLNEDKECTVTWTVDPGDNSFDLYSQITPPKEVTSPFNSPNAKITTPTSKNDADRDNIPNEEDLCPKSKSLFSDIGCPSGAEDAYPVFNFEGHLIDNSIFKDEDGRYMRLKDDNELSIALGSNLEHTYSIFISVVEDTEDTCSGYLSGYNEIDFDDGIAGKYDLGLAGEFELVITSGECNVDMMTISSQKDIRCPPQCHNARCYSKGCVCDYGEGDCDSDDDCKDGLICCDNVGAHFGCDRSTRDICVDEDECDDLSDKD